MVDDSPRLIGAVSLIVSTGLAGIGVDDVCESTTRLGA